MSLHSYSHSMPTFSPAFNYSVYSTFHRKKIGRSNQLPQFVSANRSRFPMSTLIKFTVIKSSVSHHDRLKSNEQNVIISQLAEILKMQITNVFN